MQAFLYHLVSRLRKYSFPSPSEDAIPTISVVKECANGLYIARIILLYLSKYCNEKQYAACFCQHELTWKERRVVNDVSDNATTPEKKKKHVHSSLVFELLEVLVKITCQHDGDPPHHTMSLLRTSNEARVAVYVLRLEVLHTLLVLLSTRLYRSSSSKNNRENKTPLEQLLQENTKTRPGGGAWARTLIPALFTQITSPRAPPTRSIANAIRVAASEREEEDKNKDDIDDEKEASSPSLASIDTVLKMPLHLFYMIFGGDSGSMSKDKTSKGEEPLSERCLLLLLTLIHSSPTSSNPYNTVFRSLTDEDDTTTKDDCVRVSFKKIYQALTVRTRMRLPQGVLLMYVVFEREAREFRLSHFLMFSPECQLYHLFVSLIYITRTATFEHQRSNTGTLCFNTIPDFVNTSCPEVIPKLFCFHSWNNFTYPQNSIRLNSIFSSS